MGLGGLSLGHMLVVLLVVALVFGTKRLGNIGADIGNAIQGFRKAVSDPNDKTSQADEQARPGVRCQNHHFSATRPDLRVSAPAQFDA